MGAKTWMLLYSEGNAAEILKSNPVMDRSATTELVRRLYGLEVSPLKDDGDLSYTCPNDKELVAGRFPGLAVLAAEEFCLDHPSQLDPKFIEAFSSGTLYLHAMHSVVDFFGFAVWQNGVLQRSLSLSPDSGILDDIGPRLPFEVPFWTGEHPAVDPEDEDVSYPFVFHPLELGEAALKEFFGYQLEGMFDSSLIEPENIPLMVFKR